MSVITIDQPALPSWAESGLLTVGERSELLYVYREEKKTLSKFVSPEDVARAYSKVSYDTGMIPEGFMRMGYGPRGYWGLYRQPATIVSISFFEDDPIKVPIPATLLFGVGNDYRIYAESNGKIYQAPFDNVYDDGRICWGKNAVPTVKKAADIQKAWKLFFMSPFNDDITGRLTYRAIYESMAKAKAKTFKHKLKPAKMTIERLVKIANGAKYD